MNKGYDEDGREYGSQRVGQLLKVQYPLHQQTYHFQAGGTKLRLVSRSTRVAAAFGVEMEEAELDLLAERFALERGGRSARLARQFIDSLLSK